MTPARRPAPRTVPDASTSANESTVSGIRKATNTSTERKPPILVTLDFVGHDGCAVFRSEEKIAIAVRFHGRQVEHGRLSWLLSDWNGTIIAQGEIAPARTRSGRNGIIHPGDHGPGWFQMQFHLEQTLTCPVRTSTTPAGTIAYAVLPAIEPLPLTHTDDSRFGAQGAECRDHLAPEDRIWPLVGMRWAYRARRPFEIANAGPETFKPVLDPEKVTELAPTEAEHGLCLFVDAHSLPPWLTALPSGHGGGVWTPPETHYWQSYGAANASAYTRLMGQVAAEQAALRQAAFAKQKHNYYEIHWEPNWHWKGSDDEFIQMYKAAREGIHGHDPHGLLLGANYGAIDSGYQHLARLLAKGLGEHLDGIVTHTYYLPMLYRSPEAAGIIEGMRGLANLVRRHLPAGAPILNSEWGVNCNESFARRKIDDGSRLRQEAAWFLRTHLIALGEGARTTFFYETVDPDERGGWGLFYRNPHPQPASGACHIAPKPVFAPVAAATRLLEGTTTLGPVDYLGEPTWGYAFDRAGQRILALWSRDDRPRTIMLPCGNGPIILHDPLGNTRKLRVQKGTCQIPLDAQPVFVSGLSPSALPDGTSIAAPQIMAGKNLPLAAPLQPDEHLIFYHPSAIVRSDAEGVLRIPGSLPPARGLLVVKARDLSFRRSQALEVLAPQGVLYRHGVTLVTRPDSQLKIP
jgi:hypothetical protein